MHNFRQVAALLALVGLVLLLIGRSHQTSPAQTASPMGANPPLGVPCAIEFRLPLPHGYSELYLKGKLKAVNDKWLVLYNDAEPDQGDVWISRDAVLMVITGKSVKSYKGIEMK